MPPPTEDGGKVTGPAAVDAGHEHDVLHAVDVEQDVLDIPGAA